MKTIFKIRIAYVYSTPLDHEVIERATELLEKEYDSYQLAESSISEIHDGKMKELTNNPNFPELIMNFKMMFQIEKYFVPIAARP